VIACAQCGIAMPTPTGRASRKRYCNVACRKAAWRERHRHDTSNGDMVPHTVPDVLAVPTAFPDDVPSTAGTTAAHTAGNHSPSSASSSPPTPPSSKHRR
jgi:hypothetical protein